MEQRLPCVGILVVLGFFMPIIAPDSDDMRAEAPMPIAGALPTVIIDPGHGGQDGGAQRSGLREKDLTLDVALRLEALLQRFQFPTMLTRRDDSYVSLQDRAAIANRFDPALFISIHFNETRSAGAAGPETFYADEKRPPEIAWTSLGFFKRPESPKLDNGETLAGFIQASLIMKFNAGNRGIKSKNLFVVRNVRSPAVLVEGGFISNPMEAQMLTNADYRDRLVTALAEGVLSYQRTRPRLTAPPARLASQN